MGKKSFFYKIFDNLSVVLAYFALGFIIYAFFSLFSFEHSSEKEEKILKDTFNTYELKQ